VRKILIRYQSDRNALDGGILDIFDTASRAARSALVVLKCLLSASDTILQSLVDNCCIQRHLMTFRLVKINKMGALRTFHTIVSSQWRLTSKASDGFHGEPHETSNSRCRYLDCPRVISRYYRTHKSIEVCDCNLTHIGPKLFRREWVRKSS